MRVPTGGRRIREIGEFKLIEILEAVLHGTAPGRLRVGIGDDAAVWRPRAGCHLVMTMDTLIEEQHFRLGWTDWKALGHKALAVNLSDIAAMGARPKVALVSLAVKGSERDREIADIYRGMLSLAEKHGVAIVGGDVTSSPKAMMITVTLIGEFPGDPTHMLSRSAAKPGDLLAVTGPIGLAAAGLRVADEQLNTLDGGPAMLEALLRPEPRIKEGRLLVKSGVRAGMDLSDGLLGDLPRLCSQSGVDAVIDEKRLPIPYAVRWGFDDWFDLAVRGGDDYELLFTATPEQFRRVRRRFLAADMTEPVIIGKIVEREDDGQKDPGIRIRRISGVSEDIEAGAYSHFRK